MKLDRRFLLRGTCQGALAVRIDEDRDEGIFLPGKVNDLTVNGIVFAY